MRALIFVAIGLGVANAQPAPSPVPAPPTPAPTAPAPDLGRAAELYDAANKAMAEGRYSSAARDFTAAYELSHDPVVFFKIASAHEKAGECDVAVTWYRRFIDEAKPEPKFAELAQQRIAACSKPIVEPAPTPSPTDQVPADQAPTDQAPAEPAPTTEPPAEPTAPATPLLASSSKKKDAAWLLVGGALTFVTAGAVLAYSANSSEQDLRDLYVSSNGTPPRFDANTQKRYDDLVDEGQRFERLSWAAFGLAGGCAAAATILFLRSDSPVTVTPIATPKETGVAATLRF